MKITFLGTNGWYDTDTGNTTSILVDTEKSHIVLDAGYGFYKIGKIIKDDKPISLFLSHMHLDHIIGLHTLPILSHLQGMDIYVPKGSIDILKRFLDTPYTTPFSVLSKKINIKEIGEYISSDVEVISKQLLHAVPCYGFRIKSLGKVLAYCTDTGLCDNAVSLAKEADALIAECAFGPGEANKERPFHLNPQDAAVLAKRSNVKTLCLMHFDPGRYPSLSSRAEAEAEAKKIFPNAIAATDGYELTL